MGEGQGRIRGEQTGWSSAVAIFGKHARGVEPVLVAEIKTLGNTQSPLHRGLFMQCGVARSTQPRRAQGCDLVSAVPLNHLAVAWGKSLTSLSPQDPGALGEHPQQKEPAPLISRGCCLSPTRVLQGSCAMSGKRARGAEGYLMRGCPGGRESADHLRLRLSWLLTG